MSFLEHLDELRSRLFRIAIVFVVLLAASWSVSDKILAFLMKPIREHLLTDGDIIFIALTEPFMVYMKASAIAALFLSAPYILWQFWGFVAPGLFYWTRRGDQVFTGSAGIGITAASAASEGLVIARDAMIRGINPTATITSAAVDASARRSSIARL